MIELFFLGLCLFLSIFLFYSGHYAAGGAFAFIVLTFIWLNFEGFR